MTILDREAAPAPQFDVEAVNSAKIRQPLYAPRRKIFPKRAEGFYRRLKWLVMAVTLGIYYLVPWIRWDRGPHAPDQAVLLDLESRRFYFFFLEIWPQEFYYVAGLLVMAGIGLFLITSTVGRAWCGYTCPQTVWVDLFLWVERAIEGDRNARIKLDAAPWSANKLLRRVAKHGIWIVIGLATGGAWVFYFADAPSLAADLVQFQAPAVAYFTILILTATTYTFGGLMREQVCTYMCPWPRIQAAMLDEHSLTVTYNDWRGEPRTRHTKKAIAAGQPMGDCVDCNACVVVCPMGIDIRDGQQLECITCALCIDACDNVMDKLGREQGLISYTTLSDYNHNMALATDAAGSIAPAGIRKPGGGFIDAIRRTDWRSVARPRVLVYFALWAAVGLGMLVAISMRAELGISVLHDRNPLYTVLSDGSIQNGYEVKILNMTNAPRAVTFAIDGLPGATLTSPNLAAEPVTALTLAVEPDLVFPLRIYVRVPRDALAEKTDFTMSVTAGDGEPAMADTVVRFEVPEGGR